MGGVVGRLKLSSINSYGAPFQEGYEPEKQLAAKHE